MKNLTQRWAQAGSFFDVQKGQGRLPLLLLVGTPLSVAKYASIFPRISLNILENVWIYCSDYARFLNMHGHLTCSTDF